MAAVSPPNVSVNSPTNPFRLRLPQSTDPPSETNPPTPKIWVVFGATGHIGREVVKAALSHGDSVSAVGKTLENTVAQMQGWHERCLGLLCDVRVRDTVQDVYDRTIQKWGKYDIVVNCTGYGVIGACEDQDACDLRSQFDTNFLGTLNIIQLSLPYFREQSAPNKRTKETDNAGRYLIFSSTSGALGVPGLGPYCATKYATEGLIESMLYEIDAFGIKATLVEPGHVRLDEPGGAGDDERNGTLDGIIAQTPEALVKLKRYGHFFVKPPSAPYNTPTAPAGHARRVVQWLADRKPTSAVKSAELVWQLGHCRYPPLRLLLGSFAIESVRDRLRSITEEIEDWKHLSFPVADDGGGGGGGKGKKAGGGGGSVGGGGDEDGMDDDGMMDFGEDGVADIKEEGDDV